MRIIWDNLVYIWNLITNRYLLIAYIIILSYKVKRYKFLYFKTIEKKQQEEINKNIKNNNNSDGSHNHIYRFIWTHEHEHAQIDHENNNILNKELEKRHTV